jgi:hypothetical protein
MICHFQKLTEITANEDINNNMVEQPYELANYKFTTS